MSGQTPRSELERIYRLIQGDKVEEAVAALRPVVRSDSENEDAWWLLANAATDPAEAKEALSNVLRLNPQNTQAQGLLDRLSDAYPDLIPTPSFGDEMDFNTAADPFKPVTVSTPDAFDDDEEPDFVTSASKPNYPQPDFFPEVDTAANATPARAADKPLIETPAPVRALEDEPNRLMPILMAAILVIVLGLGVFYLLNSRNTPATPATAPSPTVDTTNLAIVPTSSPEVTLDPTTSAATQQSAAPTADPNALTATLAPAATVEAGTSVAVPIATTDATTIAVAPTIAVSVEAPGTAVATPAAPATAAATSPATLAAPVALLADSLIALAEPFKTGGLSDAALTVEDTLLGKTLKLKFCSKLGADLLRNTDRARDQLAAAAGPYVAEVAALGVQIVNCADATNTLFNKIVPVAVAKAFNEKTIDARGYRSRWINP